MDDNSFAVDFDVDVEACRGRQRRLLAEMQRDHLELVVLSRNDSVHLLE